MQDIKKLLGTEKLILGTDRVRKAIRAGSVATIILASNAPEELREEFGHYQKMSGFKIEDAGIPNTELGTTCKKQFSITSIAILT